MARDPRKLRVFALADRLVMAIYDITKGFPGEEKFGLVSQMRRAAVSIPANIAEGCGRRTTSDYLRFLTIANGSAYELAYLSGLTGRLNLTKAAAAADLVDRSEHVAASLTALIESLEGADASDMQRAPDKKRSRTSTTERRAFEIALEDLPSARKKRRS